MLNLQEKVRRVREVRSNQTIGVIYGRTRRSALDESVFAQAYLQLSSVSRSSASKRARAARWSSRPLCYPMEVR